MQIMQSVKKNRRTPENRRPAKYGGRCLHLFSLRCGGENTVYYKQLNRGRTHSDDRGRSNKYGATHAAPHAMDSTAPSHLIGPTASGSDQERGSISP